MKPLSTTFQLGHWTSAGTVEHCFVGHLSTQLLHHDGEGQWLVWKWFINDQ